MQTENRPKTLSVTQHLISVTAMIPLIINSNVRNSARAIDEGTISHQITL
jgi:hypothetical protein